MKKKFIFSVSSLIVLGAIAYFGSGLMLRPISTQLIRQNGFPEANVSSISLTPQGLFIEKISLDANDFSTIENLTLTFNWIELLKNKKIESLVIKNISLTGELDSSGHIKIAGWDASSPKQQSSYLLPIQSIILQGVTIDCDTPQGDIRVEGKLVLETPNPDYQTIQYSIWGQQHQLSFDLIGIGQLSANGDMNFLTTINEGRINFQNIEISRASGKIDITKKVDDNHPTYTGQLIAGKINMLGGLMQNVVLDINTTKPEAIYFKTNLSGFQNISIEGRWVTKPNDYLELSVTSKKISDVVEAFFADEKDNFNFIKKNLDPLSLKIKSSFLSLKDETKKADFELELGRLGSKTHFKTNGQISYNSLSLKKKIDLSESTLSIAGGIIKLAPFMIDSDFTGKPPIQTQLTAKSIDMEQLAKFADVKGLTAKGLISGKIPISYSDIGINFGNGQLESDGIGNFSYTPPQIPLTLQGDDERMQLVRDALSDFQFSKLSVDINGSFDDKMKTTLKAEGKNPAMGDRPINLNLNLDGDLGAVIKQSLQMGDINDTIRSYYKKKESQ